MPPVFTRRSPESVLFITLDSCRFDTFASARLPNMKSVGPLECTKAPGNFTYGSHAAMFVGFTPGDPFQVKPLINPKFSKIFKLVGPSFPGKGQELFTLEGRSIMEGFRSKGYRVLGTGAVGWFDPETATGQLLARDFDDFFYPGNTYSLLRQLEWLEAELEAAPEPVFAFLNVGETHVPYYYEGAPWDPCHDPCLPFGSPTNDAAECARRQKACVEYVDARLGPLLQAFADSTVLICADHGDCWGEDGLWEHGIHHEKVYEVPLILRRGCMMGAGEGAGVV